MRLVWIVGGNVSAKKSLESALTLERTKLQWAIRHVNSIAQIPAKYLSNPGVIVLIDAFSPGHPGFTGLRALREKGFRGPVYIFGEPAPEDASAAFAQHKLTGFFPPFERADMDFVAGVLHASVAYDGTIDIMRFTAPGGRSSVEVIRNLHDFNAFTQKMTAFIGRFGVDLGRLRKVLMALSLPHVKTDTGVPMIEHSFPLYYGMDPHKIVMAASAFSRGATLDAMMSNYAAALGAARTDKPFTGAMFPEFHHIAKATENLLVFTGSALEQGSIDPVLLVTAMPFPSMMRPQAASYFFSFTHVVPTEEIAIDDGIEATPVDSPAPAPAPAVEPLPKAMAPSPTPVLESASSSVLIQSSDLGDLLSEPKIVGDRPALSGIWPDANLLASAAAPEGDQVTATSAAGEMPDGTPAIDQSEMAEKLREALSECEKLRKLCDSMGQDIKRLMKERRQPSSDRELRDSQARLAEEVKTLKLEKVKALEMVVAREKQIELLKVQIETIKKEKTT